MNFSTELFLVRRTLIALIYSVLLICSAAWAQTAGQLVPHSVRPETPTIVDPLPKLPTIPVPSFKPSVPSETFLIADVVFQDNLKLFEQEAAALKQRLIGQRLTPKQMIAYARELEAAYARAGYVLVRVIVPQQALVDNMALHIRVINGYIENIDLEQLPLALQSPVFNLLKILIDQKNIRLADIERALLLAGDVAGARLQSAIEAGQAPGSSKLYIFGHHRAATWQFDTNNHIAPSLGSWNTNASLTLNSVMGFGEQFYFRIGGLPNGGKNNLFSSHPRNRLLAAGLVIPINNNGTTFNLEAIQARSFSKAEIYVPPFKSRFERASARIKHPFVRSKQSNFNAEIAFDMQNENKIIGAPYDTDQAIDRLRVVRISGDINQRTNTNALVTAKITASLGIDAWGARGKKDVPADGYPTLSRVGSDAFFKKMEAFLNFTQHLSQHLQLDLKGKAQTSFNQAMSSAEQFSASGSSGLSAFNFRGMALEGDSGYTARIELASPWQFSIKPGILLVAPYLFGAHGETHLVSPTPIEAQNKGGKAYGIGLRMNGMNKMQTTGANLSVEIGKQLRRDDLPNRTRFMLAANLYF